MREWCSLTGSLEHSKGQSADQAGFLTYGGDGTVPVGNWHTDPVVGTNWGTATPNCSGRG
jgi:hypothetical protein